MPSKLAPVLLALVFVLGCPVARVHPLEIVGQGDIVSASGDRDCSLSDFELGSGLCTLNASSGVYEETYLGVPHDGWRFHGWAACDEASGDSCSFAVPANAGDLPPLVAIFRPVENYGLDSLLMGHSFFKPFAAHMPVLAYAAGVFDHAQSLVTAGGANGAPQALWENPSKRAEIQGALDGGDVELFGMTYHPDYPSLDGYVNWVDYALARNPDTRFFIALPWEPYPQSTTAATYASNWEAFHPLISHGLIDSLREMYPDVDFFCVPYGESAVALRNLFSAGNLPDVTTLVSPSEPSIYRDNLGHAQHVLVELGRLVWIRAIYDVDLPSLPYDTATLTDLVPIADAILDRHDPAYDAPYH